MVTSFSPLFPARRPSGGPSGRPAPGAGQYDASASVRSRSGGRGQGGFVREKPWGKLLVKVRFMGFIWIFMVFSYIFIRFGFGFGWDL